MAKTIFNNKKKRRGGTIAVVILVCLLAVAIAAAALWWTLGRGTEPAPDTEEPAAPATTTTTEPKKTLPKAFIDRNTYSPYVVLYDADNDTVLYSKNADKKCYPASLTKLLTALVALDYAKPEDTLTLGNEVYMIMPGSSRAYLTPGTKMTMKQLLQALLLPSGNDAAYGVAAQVGRLIGKDPAMGNQEAVDLFLKEMNKKAKALGCKKSKFINPDGYHADSHYTTAADMLKIAEAAIENDTIKGIVSTPQTTVTFLSGQSATWQNSNKLLSPNSAYTYEGAFGLKTGTTDEAGKCLAACATRDGRTSIVIVMGAESENGRWDDSRGLLDLSFQ